MLSFSRSPLLSKVLILCADILSSFPGSQASIATAKKMVALAKANRAAEAKLKEERKSLAQLKKEVESLSKWIEDLSLEKRSVKDLVKTA